MSYFKKLLLIPALFLFAGTLSAQHPSLRLDYDSVKIMNAELVLRNQTKDINGYLYNAGNGRTVFQKLGKSVEFLVGAPGYPAAGDSVYENAAIKNYFIKVMRNGLLQYRDSSDGVIVDASNGKIVFKPSLQANEHIFIEAIYGVDLSVNGEDPGDGGGEVTPPALKPLELQAGALDNGNNTFTLRWANNAKTLYLSPRIVGLGSSTLAGYNLTAPNRLGDKIEAWLDNNTANATWVNLAVGGYSTKDILPFEDGGVFGHTILDAIAINPDFIFVSLPSNDPSAGLSINQSLANLRKVDSLALEKGITVFLETTQPRTSYSTAQQLMLKELADSIRTIWPNRYVEGFNDVYDPSTPGAILPAYDNGDGTHLNSNGNQFIANHLFERWLTFFQSITGVRKYVIDSSIDQSTWSEFAVLQDPNIVKENYVRFNDEKVYFRVKAELKDGSYTDYSNIAQLDKKVEPEIPGVDDYTYRLLTDLGGDGVNTLNGSDNPDGLPSPSPDNYGHYWNNWYGVGGVSGFDTNASIEELRTTVNDATDMGIQFIGLPQGTFGTSATKSLNFNGFNVGVGDYPAEALYDNVYVHSSNNPDGIKLRIKGMVSTNKYYIKIWGARLDDRIGPRTLQAKLDGEDWVTAQSVETKYAITANPNYEQAVKFDNVTGADSVDIILRTGSGSSFAHISLIDIGVVGPLPLIPQIKLRDTTTTLSTMQLTALPINGATISSYQWTQVSGPSTATIGNATSATANISGLSNGSYIFKVEGTSTGGKILSSSATVKVFPNNDGLKTLRVNFSKTVAPSIPGWFNVYGNPSVDHISVTDPETGWTIDNVSANSQYWSPYAGSSSSNTDGTSTGNNSGIIPDIALQSYWFNYSLKYVSGMDNLTIGGLNPSKTYIIYFYASRNNSATAPRYGAWRINGGTEILQDAYNNTSLESYQDSVSPDANGVIKISVHSPSLTANGSFGYLNALVIQEEN